MSHFFDKELDEEIKSTLQKKTWNALDKCFKWQFIEAYLLNIPWMTKQDMKCIKETFSKGNLGQVVFNNKERHITTLGLEVRGQVI